MVTGLTAERGANEAMTVALGWTNPATYNTGESLSIKQINIYRNDVLLKSLTDAASTASGAAVSLTDEVPASGYYTYGVEIVDADGKKSATASVRTAYVGPLAAIAPPYTLDFSDAEEMAFWKTINGDNTNNWSIKADHTEIKPTVTSQTTTGLSAVRSRSTPPKPISSRSRRLSQILPTNSTLT